MAMKASLQTGEISIGTMVYFNVRDNNITIPMNFNISLPKDFMNKVIIQGETDNNTGKIIGNFVPSQSLKDGRQANQSAEVKTMVEGLNEAQDMISRTTGLPFTRSAYSPRNQQTTVRPTRKEFSIGEAAVHQANRQLTNCSACSSCIRDHLNKDYNDADEESYQRVRRHSNVSIQVSVADFFRQGCLDLIKSNILTMVLNNKTMFQVHCDAFDLLFLNSVSDRSLPLHSLTGYQGSTRKLTRRRRDSGYVPSTTTSPKQPDTTTSPVTEVMSNLIKVEQKIIKSADCVSFGSSEPYMSNTCHQMYQIGRRKGTTDKFCIKHHYCEDPKMVMAEGECSYPAPVDAVSHDCANEELMKASVPQEQPPQDYSSLIDGLVCSINGISIQPCKKTSEINRKLTLIQINNATHIVSVAHTTILSPNFKDIRNYLCKSCVRRNCENCGGDETYRKNFPSETPDICFCKVLKRPIYGIVSISLDEEPKTFQVDLAITKLVILEVREEVEEPKGELPTCLDCSARCDKSTVALRFIPEEVTVIKACTKLGCSIQKNTKEIVVPYGMLFTEHDVNLHLFVNDSLIRTLTVNCDYANMCDVLPCTWCWMKIINPVCYSVADGLQYLILVLCLCGLLALIYKMLRILTMIWLIVSAIGKVFWLIIKLIMRISLSLMGKTYSKTKVVYRRLEEMEGGLIKESTSETTQHVIMTTPKRAYPSATEANRNFWAKKPSTILYITILVLGLAIDSSSSCTVSSYINLQDTECFNFNETELTCRLNSKTELVLPSVGGDACLLVQTSHHQAAGSIRFKVESIRSRCLYEHQYYTYSPYINSTTKCRCWPDDLCEESVCSSFACGNKNRTSYDAPAYDHPNFCKCERIRASLFGSCGGLPTMGCCYMVGEVAQSKTSHSYEVGMCKTLTWEVDVQVQQMLDGTNLEQHYTLRTGLPTKTMFGTMILSSVSMPYHDVFSRCIIADMKTGQVSLQHCSLKTEFIKGQLGEVKCRNYNISTGRSSDCSVLEDMVDPVVMGFNLVPKSRLLNIDRQLTKLSLPIRTPEYFFDKDLHGYYFEQTVHSSFKVLISVKDKLVRPWVAQTKCITEFISLTGCIHCNSGAKLRLLSSCDGYPVLATVDCPSAHSKVPVVISGKTEYTVGLEFTQPLIRDEACMITTNQGSSQVSITGTLLIETFLDPVLERNVTMTREVVQNSVSEFLSSFSLSIPSIIRFFKWTIITGLISAIIIGCLWITVKSGLAALIIDRCCVKRTGKVK